VVGLPPHDPHPLHRFSTRQNVTPHWPVCYLQRSTFSGQVNGCWSICRAICSRSRRRASWSTLPTSRRTTDTVTPVRS